MTNELKLATKLVNSIQGSMEGVNVRMNAVYPCNASGYTVRLRLEKCHQFGSTDNKDSLDSSHHRELARIIQDMHPLTTVQCEMNALDGEHELIVSVPDSKTAWQMTSMRLKPTTGDRVFAMIHWSLSLGLLMVLFPRIETYVHDIYHVVEKNLLSSVGTTM